MARVLSCSLAMLLLLGASGLAFAKPVKVKVNILVIEATRPAGKFDARLTKLKPAITRGGYQSARVLDELNARNIEVDSSVTLQMPSKKQDLKVKFLGVTGKQKIKLRVAIRGMDFESETSHSNGGMLLVAIPGKGKSKDKATMLGVTPTIQP